MGKTNFTRDKKKSIPLQLKFTLINAYECEHSIAYFQIIRSISDENI